MPQMQLTCIFDNYVCPRMTKFGQDFNGNSREMIKIFADERQKVQQIRKKLKFAGGAAKFGQKNAKKSLS